MHLTLDDLMAPEGPEIRSVRSVTEEDLRQMGTKGGNPPRQKLRYKHHALARALAAGQQERVAGMITGFAPVTVSILKSDPAFQELMRFYASEEGKGFDQVRAQILGVGQKFIEEMNRRVTEAPEEMTMRDLRETGTVLLDRAGFGPASAQTHEVHIHSGLADALKEARRHAPFPALPPPEGRVLDGQFEVIPPAGSADPQPSIFEWDE